MTEQDKDTQDAQGGEWHDLWSHHQAQCNCTDGNHSEAHHMNAARLNSLTARVKELEQERERIDVAWQTWADQRTKADRERLQAAEARAQRLEQALEAAAEKFQRIQWVAMPDTTIMARAADGEALARAALEEATGE